MDWHYIATCDEISMTGRNFLQWPTEQIGRIAAGQRCLGGIIWYPSRTWTSPDIGVAVPAYEQRWRVRSDQLADRARLRYGEPSLDVSE